MSLMTTRFQHEMRVEFAETDLAGIVHFTQFFRYAERTEHAFYRSLGRSVAEGHDVPGKGVRRGWPRVHAEFDYVSPLRFEDRFQCELAVERVGTKSVHYVFRVAKLGEGNQADRLCGIGKVSAAFVEFDAESKTVRGAEIPVEIRSDLTALSEAELAEFVAR